MFKTFALKKVLEWIAKVPWDKFLLFVAEVRKATDLYPKPAGVTKAEEKQINLNRAEYVSRKIAELLGSNNQAGRIITVLRELAVWYFGRKS